MEQRETYDEAEAQDVRQRAEVGRNFEQEVGWERGEAQAGFRRARVLPGEKTVGGV